VLDSQHTGASRLTTRITRIMGLKRTPRYLLLTVGYSLVVNGSYLVGLLLRFEGDIPARYVDGYLHVAPVFTGSRCSASSSRASTTASGATRAR
jgi:hypothetical protein